MTLRALLLDSDRVALVSRRQVRIEEAAGLLAVLPIKIENGDVPVGIHMRADTLPSVGVQALVKHLHAISDGSGVDRNADAAVQPLPLAGAVRRHGRPALNGNSSIIHDLGNILRPLAASREIPSGR